MQKNNNSNKQKKIQEFNNFVIYMEKIKKTFIGEIIDWKVLVPSSDDNSRSDRHRSNLLQLSHS